MIDLLAFMKGDWLEPVAKYIAEHGPVDAAVMRDDLLYLRLPSAWLAYCVPAGVWGAPMLRGAVEGLAVEAGEYELPSRFIGSYSVRVGAYRVSADATVQTDLNGRVFWTKGKEPQPFSPEHGGKITAVDTLTVKCPTCWQAVTVSDADCLRISQSLAKVTAIGGHPCNILTKELQSRIREVQR